GHRDDDRHLSGIRRPSAVRARHDRGSTSEQRALRSRPDRKRRRAVHDVRQEAAARGADTYVTGEITMYTRMYAKERKINLVAGSHYSTETFGVRALAQVVEARFGIAWTFVPESPDVY